MYTSNYPSCLSLARGEKPRKLTFVCFDIESNFQIVKVTRCHGAVGGESKCTATAGKQNNVKDDTGQVTHRLCQSLTSGASQTKSIKADAKLVLLLLDRKNTDLVIVSM